MNTLTEVRSYVLDNISFSEREMKEMNASIVRITLKLMGLLGLGQSGSANSNDIAIAEQLYRQYTETHQDTLYGQEVPQAQFFLGQTVYYMADNRIVNAEVKTVRYTDSTDHLCYDKGFRYFGEFGQLPDKIFASKVEVVLDLLGLVSEFVLMNEFHLF